MSAGEPSLMVTDAIEDRHRDLIADRLADYNESKAGYRDYRPLAVLVTDPESGEVVGGLYGRTSLGLMYVDRFFLPETLRRNRLGSQVIAAAEEEARRRGCSRALLSTLEFQAPGFYLKRGYEIAAKIECDPPGATRFYMTKRL